jgi:hypothetical protein
VVQLRFRRGRHRWDSLARFLDSIRRFDALPMAMSRSATGQSCAFAAGQEDGEKTAPSICAVYIVTFL